MSVVAARQAEAVHADGLEQTIVAALAALPRASFQLDLPGPGQIDLPPITGSADDQQALRGIGALYLASELEAAGLVTAVESLAGGFEGGALATDVGPAGALLVQFWRTRNQRFSQAERQAFFGRLFGELSGPGLAADGGRNTEFDGLMVNLTEALHRLYPASVLDPGTGSDAGVRAAGEALAANLLPRGRGMAAFAGPEILRTVHEAIRILKVPQLQFALGARTVWEAVGSVARMAGRQQESPVDHVERGQSGMVVLTWLAGVVTQLEGYGGTLVPPGSPVLTAATTWLQSSLAIAERRVPPGQA
jgi:hypothetical protein